MPDAPQTVTLSDGSVWEYDAACDVSLKEGCWRIVGHDEWCSEAYLSTASIAAMRFVTLTASDHRKIADVLDAGGAAERGEKLYTADQLATWLCKWRDEGTHGGHNDGEHVPCEQCVAHAAILLGAARCASTAPQEGGEKP